MTHVCACCRRDVAELALTTVTVGSPLIGMKRDVCDECLLAFSELWRQRQVTYS